MSCKKCKTNKCECEVTTCINPLIYMIKDAFSLVETSTNNLAAMTILSEISVNYPVPVPPPAEYTYTLPLALVQVLSSGISISNNKNYCCPDCKNGVYFLGGAQNFMDLQTDPGFVTTKICCLDHASTVQTWADASGVLKNQYECCNTDFNEIVQQWFNASSSTSVNFYLDDILKTGILESSSFNGYSGLGILFNYLQLNHPELTTEDYLNILGVIVNLGIVIECNGCEMIIASTETYIQSIGAGGGAGAGLPAQK